MSVANSKKSSKSRKDVINILEKNFQNNLDSDYTEKIEQLDKQFDYESSKNEYWSKPELSFLYGTPLYEQCSETQKLALNHLHWSLGYMSIANSEAEVTNYNLITGEILGKFGEKYKSILKQLEHETAQERVHIHAFYKISHKTHKKLLGNRFLLEVSKKSLKKSGNLSSNIFFIVNKISKLIVKNNSNAKGISSQQRRNESTDFLASTNGYFHGFQGDRSRDLKYLFASSWGKSEFLASNFYLLRYLSNLFLKSYEEQIYKYCLALKKQGKDTPIATEISYYHLLDEAFHTTTSLFCGQELFKNFPQPSYVEKFIANLGVYLTQLENLSSISGIAPSRFMNDAYLMDYIYMLFKSPIFSMDHQEALNWMEKCFCKDHEGFHINLNLHQKLLKNSLNYPNKIDYLWPVNKQLKIMASVSIEKAIKNNIASFKKFTKSISTSM